MPTVTQTASIPLRSSGWSDSVTLQQVDPALGIQSLALSLTGMVASTVSVTSGDAAPAVFDSTAAGSVALARPDGSSWLGAVAAASIHAVLPAAFSTGAVPMTFSASGSATSSVGYLPAGTASADAALLIGTGQVTLPVTGSARVYATGPANMSARFQSLVGADVSLTEATGGAPAYPGGTGGVSGTDVIIVTPPFYLDSRSKSQTLTAADAAIGTKSSLTFDGFNPALGVLYSVSLAIAVDASGSARMENLDPVSTNAGVAHTATATLDGPDGTALVSSTALFTNRSQLAAFDGTDDLLGASSATFSESAVADTYSFKGTSIVGAGLAAFEAGSVALGVARTGSTSLDGPGNLNIATTLQAGATITLTYHYVAPTVRYTNTGTGISGTATSDIYAGPVAGLQRQYIWTGTDGAAISTDAPDVFLHGGAGNDALSVSRGTNVLDGGAGSNFLTGSTGTDGGTDTFFVDARGGATTWSTLVNFHAGDTATIFGFHAGLSTRPYTANDGAAGYTGLTIHAETKGAGTGADASLTFAGLTQATADAHWSITAGTLSPGTAAATGYLLIQWNH